MDYNFDYWKRMEPMKYYDKQDDALSETLKKKRHDMIDNKDNMYIASEKWDGEWGMFIKYDDQYLIRSRSISKKTGEYGDKTAHLPHLVEEMKSWPNRCVVLAEICWGAYNTVSTDVGTIMRCLPDKAIERQKERKLVAKVFDVLLWDDQVFMNKGYAERVNQILALFPNTYFQPTNFYTNNFADQADRIISQGGEGVVIQLKNYTYEPGKRAAWKTLKLKQRLPEMELPIICTLEPNKWYDGKESATWQYRKWEDAVTKERRVYDHIPNADEVNNHEMIELGPVTKPFAMGWKIGVRVEYEDTTVDVTSGLTDEEREWLATPEAQQLIADGQLYAIVQGMMKNTLGAIRHPIWKGCRIMDEAMKEGLEWF